MTRGALPTPWSGPPAARPRGTTSSPCPGSAPSARPSTCTTPRSRRWTRQCPTRACSNRSSGTPNAPAPASRPRPSPGDAPPPTRSSVRTTTRKGPSDEPRRPGTRGRTGTRGAVDRAPQAAPGGDVGLHRRRGVLPPGGADLRHHEQLGARGPGFAVPLGGLVRVGGRLLLPLGRGGGPAAGGPPPDGGGRARGRGGGLPPAPLGAPRAR